VTRTPKRGLVAAGAALGTVSVAVGVLGASAAEAATKPIDATTTVSAASGAEGTTATSEGIAAERRSLIQQAAAVAAVAGATATTPPKAKRRPPGRPKAKVKPKAPVTPRAMAQVLVTKRGWSSAEFHCLDELWTRESGWDPHNENGGSGAYGIPQSLPGSKMASFGSDWRSNPMTQIKWGLWYIADRYSTPCNAWAHSQRYGYY
jgi:hypothetical protein